MIYRPPPPPGSGPEPEPPPMPATRRDLLAAIRELVGEVADVPQDRRRYLLQSLGGVVQGDLEALYQVLMFLRIRAEEVGPLRTKGTCACGAITTRGILCPRCGTIAE